MSGFSPLFLLQRWKLFCLTGFSFNDTIFSHRNTLNYIHRFLLVFCAWLWKSHLKALQADWKCTKGLPSIPSSLKLLYIVYNQEKSTTCQKALTITLHRRCIQYVQTHAWCRHVILMPCTNYIQSACMSCSFHVNATFTARIHYVHTICMWCLHSAHATFKPCPCCVHMWCSHQTHMFTEHTHHVYGA